MAKKYFSMNEVPVGTEMLIKNTGKKAVLLEVQHFPTTFKVKDEDDNVKNYYTYEVEIKGWPPNEDID
tara:strand:- start:70 stop:273 length:204 start_codon:yes stop_codon:yes gene_type:complete